MKAEQIIICVLSLYLIYILFFKDVEDFELSSGIITDKSLLDPSKYYQVGTLNAGIVATMTEAVAGGKACDALPQVVYKLAVPKDATCTPQVDGNYTFSQIVSGSSINPRFFKPVDLTISGTVSALSSWVSYNSSGAVYISSAELINATASYAIFSKGVFSPKWTQSTTNYTNRIAVSSGNFALACVGSGSGVFTSNQLYPNSIAPATTKWDDGSSVTGQTTRIDIGYFPLSLTAGGNTLNQQQFNILVQAANPHLITFGRIGTQWTSVTNLPTPSTSLRTPITDLSIDGTIVSLIYYTAKAGSTPSKTQIFYADFAPTYPVVGTSVGPFTPANLSWKEVFLPYVLKTAYISSDFRGFGIKEDGTLVACKDVRVATTTDQAVNTWFAVSLITPGLSFSRVCYRKNDLDLVMAVTTDNKLHADFNASNIFA